MEQVQAVQKPMQSVSNPPRGFALDQNVEKKSGWTKWIIILVVLLVLGGLAWWIFTP